MRLMQRNWLVSGSALCTALLLSTAAQAQAPVYDVNNTGNTAELEKRISVLERMVDSRTQMQHRLQQQLDTMQGEIDQLRGSVEVHTNQLEKVLERQRELYLEIDKRVEALKRSSASATPSGNNNTASSGAASSPARSSQPQVGESEAYDNAVNLILKSREYDKAIPAFREFIADFPNSDYSANAHYWLGQLLFNKQQWADSKEQFAIVAERFQDSSKRAEALLKLGVIEQRQGNTQQARQYYNAVISEYPNSSAKRLAESKLNSL